MSTLTNLTTNSLEADKSDKTICVAMLVYRQPVIHHKPHQRPDRKAQKGQLRIVFSLKESYQRFF